nr:T9SS type A sorting domain-containing protein [Candidatus Cloacimonadota bacterium]
SDNAVYEYKTMDVTEYVMDDYNNNRDKTQYRIRFWINTDWDDWWDVLTFISGNWTENRPYIRLVFSNVGVIEENLSSNNFLNTYPNPFNSEVNIEYSMDCSKNNLEIYNIKGQKVYSQMNLPVSGSLVWKCEDHKSGIYIVKISNSKQKYVKKITYLK